VTRATVRLPFLTLAIAGPNATESTNQLGKVPGVASPEIQRTVRRQGADIDSIYEILTVHGEDLHEIKATLADHGAKLGDHGTKLTTLAATLAGHGAKLTTLSARLDDHGATLADHGAKLDEVLSLLRQLTGDSAPRQ
jgi:hypothetical protein